MMFFADAVDCGVIKDEDSALFLSGNKFIAAATAAYIPIPWFIDIVTKVETVVKHFCRLHRLDRPDYDQRSTGFCAERLHAMLLSQYAEAYGWDKLVSVPLTVLSGDGTYEQ